MLPGSSHTMVESVAGGLDCGSGGAGNAGAADQSARSQCSRCEVPWPNCAGGFNPEFKDEAVEINDLAFVQLGTQTGDGVPPAAPPGAGAPIRGSRSPVVRASWLPHAAGTLARQERVRPRVGARGLGAAQPVTACVRGQLRPLGEPLPPSPPR